MGPPGVSGVCHHGCVFDAVGAFMPEDGMSLPVRDATTAVIGRGVLLKDFGACKDCMNSKRSPNK
jgi:hypothetical protein